MGRGRELKRVRREGQGCKGEIPMEGVKLVRVRETMVMRQSL